MRSRQEQLEREDAQKAIEEMFMRNTGPSLIKYLFKMFRIGELPGAGIPNDILNYHLGELNAGQEFFNFVAEAHYQKAGEILAQIKKEKDEAYVQEIHQRDAAVSDE